MCFLILEKEETKSIPMTDSVDIIMENKSLETSGNNIN